MTLEDYIQRVWSGQIVVTPTHYPVERPFERGCGAEKEGWRCTLPLGHENQHEAYGGGAEPYYVWPNE
jgi:hypothetical protein